MAIIEVTQVPSLSFQSIPDQCVNNAPYQLVATPQGGVFQGPGVTGNQFHPSVADTGVHELFYIYTLSSGCSDTAVQNVTVIDIPQVSFNYTHPTLCTGDAPVTLTGGSPAGGTYSGPGVSGGIFDPGVAGNGVHNLTYTVTGSNGCAASDTHVITIYDGGPPLWDAPQQICENSGQIVLQDGFPNGGVFSGTSVTANTFDPAAAGPGGHEITYSVQNNCGSGSVTDTLFVDSVTLSSFQLPDTLCASSTPVSLTGVPAGGTFSGAGVNGSVFHPSLSGTGSISVQYVYENAAGCSDTSLRNVQVNPVPAVSLVVQDSVCVNGAPINLSGGAPSGGVYTGTGVSQGLFIPATGTGIYDIVYSYSDANGCVASDTAQITVFDTPDPSWTAPGALCLGAGVINLGSGNPAGGTFSGTGISGSNFDPAAAGPGLHAITYTVNTVCGNKSVTDSILVRTQAQVSLPQLPALCEYDTAVSLSGKSPQNGVLAGPGIISGFFDPRLAGTGYHQVIYSYVDSNGCSAADTQVYVVNAKPQVNMTLPEIICENAPELPLVTGQPAGGIYSGTGVNQSVFQPDEAGTGVTQIVYTIEDSNGCIAADTGHIEVLKAPVASLNDEVVCLGATVEFEATGDSILWSTGETTSTIVMVPQSDTVVWVEVLSQNGCTANDTALINVLDTPMVNIEPNEKEICLTDTASFFAPPGFDAYLWNTGDETSVVDIPGMMAGVGLHSLLLEVIDSNGCSGRATALLRVINCDTTSVPEWKSLNNSVTVYPNPSNGLFTAEIQWPVQEVLELTLVTLSGQHVTSMRDEVVGTAYFRFDEIELAPGSYFLIVKGEAGHAVKKVMIGR